MFYVYKLHTGGYYILLEELEPDLLDCPTCGGSDYFAGQSESMEGVYKIIDGEEILDDPGFAGYGRA